MNRTQESGAYLGGIGTMLEVADVCTNCGRVHTERQFSLQHRGPRECPSVVMGSYPVLTVRDVIEVLAAIPLPVPLAVPANSHPARTIGRREIPVSLGSLPGSRTLEALSASSPDLGEAV